MPMKSQVEMPPGSPPELLHRGPARRGQPQAKLLLQPVPGPQALAKPQASSASGASFQRPSDMGKMDAGKLGLKLASTEGPLGATG